MTVTAGEPPAAAPAPAGDSQRRQLRRIQLNEAGPRQDFARICREVDRVVVRLPRDGGQGEYLTAMIGRLDGDSLLIDWPADKDGLVALKAGDRIEVKLFTSRDLVMFQVDIVLCCFRPRPYIHLAWPREVSIVGVREITRVPLSKAAKFLRLQPEGGDVAELDGRIADASLGGASLICAEDVLKVGEIGELLVSLRTDPSLPRVAARPRCAVRNRRVLPSGEGVHYGLQFLDAKINDHIVMLAIVGLAALRREE